MRPLVREIFSRVPNGMGYRQVAMALRAEQGLAISGKTVLGLMREEGLRCRIRRRRYNSYRGERGKAAGNILDRDFAAKAPMRKLVTDVTEFKVAGAKAYLSPVMDLYNNEIVAWSVSRSPNFAQTMEMLDGLEPRLRGPALLHSDQGWQYQQLSFQERLKKMGLTQSMSRKATCLDNACMEGFFGHLKDEFYRGRDFKSFESFKEQLDSYIHYWNTCRYQARLKGMTPVQYRGHSIRAA
ncbi:MAG: IS3 family transposase [Oscillospiraceae bacterium]|nr:IS3 family transposase [Oscillospiraceae bacterium]